MDESSSVVPDLPEFRLAALFEAHNADVKQVLATSVNSLLSCSRDDTIKQWGSNLYNPKATNLLANYCPSPPMQVNSLAFVDYKGTFYIFGGRKDGSIVVYEGNSTVPLVVLKGHSLNVCCLHVNKEYGFLVSGGWDHTAIIWSLDAVVGGNTSDFLTLEGHQHSVWAIDSFKDLADSVLTGSADRTVKLWRGNELLKTYEVHGDVVRSIICLDGGYFVTGCNDGKIRLFHRDNEKSISTTVTQAEEYIYSMAMVDYSGKKFLIASMETGALEVYSYISDSPQKLRFYNSLQIPCSSAWSVTVMENNDIVVGGSDGFIYVISIDPERYASDDASEIFDVRMSLFMAERKEIAQKMREQQEQAVTVIKVTLDDTNKSLDLRYVKGTDPHVAAENFIRTNNLPMSYLPEIVQYIKINVPAAGRLANKVVPLPRGQPAPLTDFIKFSDLPPSHIALDKLVTFNAVQDNHTKLSDEQLASIESIMTNPQCSISAIHIEAFERGLQWGIDELPPILHTFCVGLLNKTFITQLFARSGHKIFERLVNLLVSDPKDNIAIFILRSFANMAEHKVGRQILQQDVSLICDLSLKNIQSNNLKLQMAAASVLANMSLVLWKNTVIEKVAELGPREDAVRSIIKAFESDFNFDISPPALILLLQAIGTVLWEDNSVICLAKNRNLLKFINVIKDKVSDDSGKSVAREVAEMIHAA